MPREKRILADVGLNNLPFPMRVVSKIDKEGQSTIGNISIKARIIQEYEAYWINKFIQIIHTHRDKIGTKTLRSNIHDYIDELKATSVKIDFEYPFFMEKVTPVSHEKCLVKYNCTYSAKITATEPEPKIIFKIAVPVITTDPSSDPSQKNRLFGQLSIVNLKIQSKENIYAEDLVNIVDKRALAPVYSFLTAEDQLKIIDKVHLYSQSSVVMANEIQNDLAKRPDIDWYSVKCNNYSLLHSYNTLVATEKSMWIPSSCYDFEEL